VEEEPLSVQPEPGKNGSRRLVITLITILFLVSLGYLAYQLWPILGDKVRELVSYLKELF
jgi:cell division septal protein FtsQ